MLQRLYHRLVPASVRYPIGRRRRALQDRLRRLAADRPLPPRGLLERVQATPWVHEYQRVGRRSAASISDALSGLPTAARVLDFGCGLGRTLSWLDAPDWRLFGCDVDAALVTWSATALPETSFAVTPKAPTLPYRDDAFDAVYAVSVFSHFDAAAQAAWAAELGRITRVGGQVVVTTMGPWALSGFPNLASAENEQTLERDGFLHLPGTGGFNSHGSFHTNDGLRRFFAPHFELESWAVGGLDGFQDLARLRRG